MSVLMRMFVVFIILFIMLGILASYEKGRLNEINQPVWNSSGTSLPTDELMIDEDKQLKLQIKSNDLVLLRKSPLKPLLLFTNYKNKFYHLEMYIKDIDLDGKKEIVFQVDKTMYEREVYVFSEIYKNNVKKYTGKEEFLIGGNLLFTEKNKIYIRSCGSQYCNDTYYIWDGVKLTKEYTDSYESM